MGYESMFNTNKKKSLTEKKDNDMETIKEESVEEKVERKPVHCLSEQDESQILLLNEILKRIISLEEKIEKVKVQESSGGAINRKIVVERDESGKIIGANIVEGE